MTNNNFGEDSPIVGKLTVISMRGCEAFTSKIDDYLKQMRPFEEVESYNTHIHCTRFGTGEGKGVHDATVRGQDVYII